MHVVMIADLAPGAVLASGVQRATVTLAEVLAEQGVRVTLVTPTPGDPALPDRYAFPVVRVHMGGRLQLLRDFRPWQTALADTLDRLKPDVVHAQGMLHNGIAAVRCTKAPVIVTAHGDPIADARAHYPAVVNRGVVGRLRRTVVEILSRADHVVDVSADWRVNLPTEPARWSFIPNPVESRFFAEEPAPRETTVLYFGGKRRIKGLDVLLDAWPEVRRSCPSAELHAYGLETTGNGIDERCARTPGCSPLGEIASHEVSRVMRRGGVLAVPSRYEVSPIVIAEAWACELPVVACDVGGISALDHGALGLCPVEDAAALATELSSALIGSKLTRDKVMRGLELVQQQRPENVAAAYLELYTRLRTG